MTSQIPVGFCGGSQGPCEVYHGEIHFFIFAGFGLADFLGQIIQLLMKRLILQMVSSDNMLLSFNPEA